jgi:hypothetical protein
MTRKRTSLQKVLKTGAFPSAYLLASTECLRSTKIAVEAQHGLIAQVIKDVIFSMRPHNGQNSSASQVSDIVDTSMAIG